MISTRFWSDNFIVELNPLDRYLFLYFLTNEHTNICGIYELPLKRMSDETGLEKDMLLKMLKRLKGKIYYIDGWVYIKNFAKHQSDSDKIKTGIKNGRQLVPKKILDYIYDIDKVSIPLQVFESELELESELESKEYVSAIADDSFNQFWSKYPKKELKKKTQDIWKRKKLGRFISEILEFIEKASNTDRWKKGFIKQPPAFLNGECWNDDLATYNDFQKEVGLKITKFN